MPEAAPSKDLTAGTLLGLFGGVKGLIDSSVPATVFVVARLFADLNASVVAAVVAGLLVVAVRKARGESLQQAFSGFFGLVLAVVIVRSTGTGKGFFLPGILITAASGVAFLVSLVVGRPAVALGLAAFDPRYAVWREHAALRRACVLATAVWTASFFIRAGVATTVALSVGDKGSDNAVILIVINAVKWPLIIGSALYTVALVKKADVPELEPSGR
ncbi:MAG: hypothetical protein JWM02_466 [Frankiales bacterium]|nr:hypothetical protein [Frankiales bacterium]